VATNGTLLCSALLHTLLPAYIFYFLFTIIIVPSNRLSYTEANKRIINIASGLATLTDKGDTHVGLFSINREEWVLAEHASFRQSFITVPLYDTLGIYIFIDSPIGMSLVFIDSPIGMSQVFIDSLIGIAIVYTSDLKAARQSSTL